MSRPSAELGTLCGACLPQGGQCCQAPMERLPASARRIPSVSGLARSVSPTSLHACCCASNIDAALIDARCALGNSVRGSDIDMQQSWFTLRAALNKLRATCHDKKRANEVEHRRADPAAHRAAACAD